MFLQDQSSQKIELINFEKNFTDDHQCFFFSRNVGQGFPKIIIIYYLTKYFLDQSIQKTFNLILKTEALRTM